MAPGKFLGIADNYRIINTQTATRRGHGLIGVQRRDKSNIRAAITRVEIDTDFETGLVAYVCDETTYEPLGYYGLGRPAALA